MLLTPAISLLYATVSMALHFDRTRRAVADPNVCSQFFTATWVGRFCSSDNDRHWMDLCWLSDGDNMLPAWQVGSTAQETLVNAFSEWWMQIDETYLDPDGMNWDRVPTVDGYSYMAIRACPHDYLCLGYIDKQSDAHIQCILKATVEDGHEAPDDTLVYIGEEAGMAIYGIMPSPWPYILRSGSSSDADSSDGEGAGGRGGGGREAGNGGTSQHQSAAAHLRDVQIGDGHSLKLPWLQLASSSMHSPR